jgi:aryl sulfotransferase
VTADSARSEVLNDIEWPVKQREIQNHHMDSRCWNEFPFRNDDIVIGTYLKCGTTWTQQIVGQLLFNGQADINVQELSPWIDQRVPGRTNTHKWAESQTHRRFLKTHLPVDALVFSPKAKYIHVDRDGRDMMWSLHNHHYNANELYYAWVNDSPRRVGPTFDPPPEDPREYFLTWLEKDGFPLWSFWNLVRSWWNVRNLPNVYHVHYSNLKADLSGEMRRIADFLEIDVAPDKFDDAVEHCTFDWMKQNAESTAPAYGVVFEGGANTFINKGTNNRWKDALTPADIGAYEARALEELGPECATWLATGKLP